MEQHRAGRSCEAARQDVLVPYENSASVADPARLQAVRATGLLDTPAEKVFDDLASAAAQLIGMPLAFITVVDEGRSYWKAVVGAGIAAEDTVGRQNNVEQSFCRYLIDADGPVVVSDASTDELTRDNPSVATMGVRAWAGYPVRDEGGHVLGSFCVIDTIPRQFTAKQLHLLETLAEGASREVALRAALRQAAVSAAFGQAQAGQAAAANTRLLQQAEASEVLGASLDVQEVLAGLRRLVVPELGTWLVVALRDELVGSALGLAVSNDRRRVTVVDVCHADPAGEQGLRTALDGFPLSIDDGAGVGLVIRTGEPEYRTHVEAEDLHFADAPNGAADLVAAAQVDSALTVPLASRGKVLGAMTISAPPMAGLDQDLLIDLGRRAGIALDNALSYGAQHRMGTELQRSLMPARPPSLPDVQMVARYLPATSGALAGGDFHQVVRRGHDLVLVLGDVEGHGMTSAARMGQLRAAVAALALEGHDPGSLLARLAADTGQILDISLATLLVATFDPATRRVTLASAGHPPAVVADSAGNARFLDVDPGPPLGAGPATFTEYADVLHQGDVLVLYSDGLVERRGEDLSIGLQRLAAGAAKAHPDGPLEDYADAVLDACGCATGGDDDIALLVLRCSRTP